MSRRHAEAGFTLLEVLVVTVVFGLLSVGLWQGIGIGTRGWSRAERGYGADAMFQGAEDTLRRLIERADLSDSGVRSALAGDRERLRVISWLPQGKGYEREVEAAFGVDARHRLVLRWRRYRRADCRGETDAAHDAAQDYSLHEEVLASDVQGVVFSYYGASEGRVLWRDDWSAEALPALVRVRIVSRRAGVSWPPILVRPLLAVGASR